MTGSGSDCGEAEPWLACKIMAGGFLACKWHVLGLLESKFLGSDPGYCVDVGQCDVCASVCIVSWPISNTYTSAISGALWVQQ